MPVDPSPHTAGPMPPSGGAVVRRARPIYRVFVSSTWVDLQPERRALMDALNRMEEMRFVGMEFFGNRPDDTHDASIDQVDLCEVFVGIIGHRYGSGITEAEYRRARALNLPCFVYFKRGETSRPELTDNDPALAAKLVAFKQDLLRGHTVKEFERPEELAANATADLHNWVAAQWITTEAAESAAVVPSRRGGTDVDRTNVLRLLERIDQDWIKGVLEASLHHRAWLELGLDWREDAVEHPWDRIVVAANRPIQTLSKGDSIAGVFDAAQHTLLVLGEPGAGKTTTVLELARDLIARARASAGEPAPVVLALSTWRGQHKDLLEWLVAELGLRYQIPKRVARTWLEEGRLVLILDGLDEVTAERRAACVDAINAFEQAHPPPGLAVTCRVAEYEALATKLRLRSAICLQPLTPAQVDRYFAAAGPSLASLRATVQDDAGLRELARSPLMLSVMTMAWRDAPAGTTAPFAHAQTPERLRSHLFDAYMEAALRRRGKAAGGYTPEQTTKWLVWLASRMKEHGLTLFSLEQLQPGWLMGRRNQVGYMLLTRVMGCFALVVPFLGWGTTITNRLACAGLAVVLGLAYGAIDSAMLQKELRVADTGSRRFWLMVITTLGLAAAWIWVVLVLKGSRPDRILGYGELYLLMAAFSFIAPVDVRSLDIKLSGTMRWSTPQALARFGIAVVGFNLLIALVMAGGIATILATGGAAEVARMFADAWYVSGLLLGAAAGVAIGRGIWPRDRVLAVSVSVAAISLGGQFGALTGRGDSAGFTAMLLEFALAAFIGIFGGFASGVIDPAKARRSTAWIWLRVPLSAFVLFGLLASVPGIIILSLKGNRPATGMDWESIQALVLLGAGVGLVGFFRFGGFNGLQHGVLRLLLVRGGMLPPRADRFFDHAAQVALMQKVGFGYRFIHALLLQHLATPIPETARPVASVSVEPWGRRGLRLVAGLGLGAGLGLLVWLAAASLSVQRIAGSSPPPDVLGSVMGALVLSLALAIPVLWVAGRWLGRRPWTELAAGWLSLAVIFGWLAHDEPRAPVATSLAGAATVFPGADKSYALLTRYTITGFGVDDSFRWGGLNFSQGPEQGKLWREFVVSHRAQLESNWEKLAKVRAWLDGLNSFERIADLDPDLLDFTSIRFQARAAYAQTAMAMASLRAIDGDGDAALDGLRPLVEAGGRLASGARTGAVYYAGREMQSVGMRAAQFVLENSQASRAARVRFAASLAAGIGGPEGARRIYAIRYAAAMQASDSFGSAVLAWGNWDISLLQWPLDLVGPVAFNPEATRNRWATLFAGLAEDAAQRNAAQAEKRVADFIAQEGRPRFKNIGGSWMALTARQRLGLNSVADQQVEYWASEDKRAALLERLRRP